MINEAETETETEEAQTERDDGACGDGVCSSLFAVHRMTDNMTDEAII